MERHSRIAVSLLFSVITLASSSLLADSPPNINEDINWVDSGGEYASETKTYDASFGGVSDIELAFNHARREEEKQLGLTPGKLGNLDLPPQQIWNGMSDDAKALYLVNAERTARAGMTPGVIGLPLAGVEANIDAIAHAYGDRLHDYDLRGHYHDGPPSFRLERDPVIGSGHYDGITYPVDPSQGNPELEAPTPWEPVHSDGSPHYLGDDFGDKRGCHEFITRSENLAYYASTAPIPMPVERSIYSFIYDDASSNWGHRESVLLQDRSLGTQDHPDGFPGFDNNHGSSASEGFMGLYVRSSSRDDANFYEPFGDQFNYGTVLVMEFFDPVADGVGDCSYNVTLRTEELPTSSGEVALLAVDDAVSTPPNTAIDIAPLANDIGVSAGDSIAIATDPAHGSTTLLGSNQIRYLPSANFTGIDTLAYRVSSSDGKRSSSATITVNVGSSVTATDSSNPADPNPEGTAASAPTTTAADTSTSTTGSGGGGTNTALLITLLGLRQLRHKRHQP